MERSEGLARSQGLDPSLLYTAMGRIYACMQKYKKAAELSGKARMGFLKIWSQKFSLRQKSINQRSHSQSKTESVVEYDEESEIYRQLSIACYTHGSHLDKLGNHADGVKYVLEARDYHEKITTLIQKDYEFYHTIEAKIIELRQKINNLTTFAENESLIKSRADQNLSRLNLHSQTTPDLKSLPLVHSKVDLRAEGAAVGATSSKLPPRSRPLTAISSSSKFTTNHSSSKQTEEQARVYRIIKQAAVPKYNKVAKDPAARKNVDSSAFRVAPLYLHNEYFHGNYDKGVEMFKSTSNNEKFFPYKALNPIPNDPAYVYKTRPTAKIRTAHTNHQGLKSSRQQAAVRPQSPPTAMGDGLELSFDEAPAEVVDLTPHAEADPATDHDSKARLGSSGKKTRAAYHPGSRQKGKNSNGPLALDPYSGVPDPRLPDDHSESHNMSQLDERDEF